MKMTGIMFMLALLLSVAGLSCVYYNTFYNARKSYEEAMELADENPDNPVSAEEILLDRAIDGAAKVLALYPDSKWADDAQLLLGDAFLQSGKRTLTGSGTSDFAEAMMAYASAAVMSDDPEITDRAAMGMGLAAMELGRYGDASAFFGNVSRRDERLYSMSRIHLMDALLKAGRPGDALAVADSMTVPGDDSLAAEMILMKGMVFMEEGRADTGAVLALEAARRFGRGEGYYRAMITAAEAYLEENRPEDAVEVLDRLLAGYRSNFETAAVALLDGKAKELSGDITGALESYRSAADLDPYRAQGAEALYRRALLLEKEGRLEDALSDLNELAARTGDYMWIRLATDRSRDLRLLLEYMKDMEDAGEEERWLREIMVAEKRMDLYGPGDSLALEHLFHVREDAPPLEKAASLVILSQVLPVPPDSVESLLLEAYALSDSSDIATEIEDKLGLPRRSDYAGRPSVVLERAWEIIGKSGFRKAWEMLDRVVKSPRGRISGPELLWAAYVAGEGARVDDGILEDYLNMLVERYPDHEYARAAESRLYGGETEEEEEEEEE